MNGSAEQQSVPPGRGAAGAPPDMAALLRRLLPPTFPPGADPETYRIEEVHRLLRQAAYFSIFSVPNPASPNQPVLLTPLFPFGMIAVEVNEDLHRFEIEVHGPSRGRGVTAANRVGEPVAGVHIRWTPMPDDFEAGPGRVPPPTLLNPFRSQRFCMLDGQLTFKDGRGSGFHAFGAGRTFPVAGAPGRLHIGAVIDVLEGLGELAGFQGTVTVNGFIEPPNGLAVNLMVRFLDPQGRLAARSPLPPLQPVPDPDPDAVFMTFLGEVDPSRPVELLFGPDGMPIGSRVFERLRRVRIDSVAGPGGMGSVTSEGPVAGTVSARLYFNFLDPSPVTPIRTTDGVFTFFDEAGGTAGTVLADMVEGRAFRTPLPGAPMPVYRFGGFGPILGGTGQLAGAAGMMSLNAAISVFPRTLSNLYILRFEDPQGKLRARANGRF